MTTKGLGALAAVLFVVGIIVGFVPSSSQGVKCGSAFAPRDTLRDEFTAAMTGQDWTNQCDDARGRNRIIALVVMGVGVAGGVGAAASSTSTRKEQQPVDG